MRESTARVIRFEDRRTAYAFVSELRRLYSIERWAALRVHVIAGAALVELPASQAADTALGELAERHGGWAPVGGSELADLRRALSVDRRTAEPADRRKS